MTEEPDWRDTTPGVKKFDSPADVTGDYCCALGNGYYAKGGTVIPVRAYQKLADAIAKALPLTPCPLCGSDPIEDDGVVYCSGKNDLRCILQQTHQDDTNCHVTQDRWPKTYPPFKLPDYRDTFLPPKLPGSVP